jgi:lactate permease
MVDATLVGMALLPLVAITVLMVVLYQPATRTMPVAWVIAVAVGYVGWGMGPELIGAATIAGVFTATEIL